MGGKIYVQKLFSFCFSSNTETTTKRKVSTCGTTMKTKIQKPVKWTNYICHHCTLISHRIMTHFQTPKDLASLNIVMSLSMATKRHITVLWVFINLKQFGSHLFLAQLPLVCCIGILNLRGDTLNITFFRCWNHRADELQTKIIQASYLSWMKCHTLRSSIPLASPLGFII